MLSKSRSTLPGLRVQSHQQDSPAQPLHSRPNAEPSGSSRYRSDCRDARLCRGFSRSAFDRERRHLPLNRRQAPSETRQTPRGTRETTSASSRMRSDSTRSLGRMCGASPRCPCHARNSPEPKRLLSRSPVDSVSARSAARRRSSTATSKATRSGSNTAPVRSSRPKPRRPVCSTPWALAADEVAFVPRLRCHGCPAAPFVIAKVVEATHTAPLYEKALDYEDSHDFEWVVLERKFDARPIETEQLDGWSFHELDRIDQSKGGAPRAHVDALRLLAVFLAHWDNKAPNQRLVCLSRDWREGTPCRAPFAMIQDLGATFGPRKVDLEAWERADIFDDRARCRISMRRLAVRRCDVRPRPHQRSGSAASGWTAVAALRSAADRSLRRRALRSAALDVHRRSPGRGMGSRLQGEGARHHGRSVVSVRSRLRLDGCRRARPGSVAAHRSCAPRARSPETTARRRRSRRA